MTGGLPQPDETPSDEEFAAEREALVELLWKHAEAIQRQAVALRMNNLDPDLQIVVPESFSAKLADGGRFLAMPTVRGPVEAPLVQIRGLS